MSDEERDYRDEFIQKSQTFFDGSPKNHIDRADKKLSEIEDPRERFIHITQLQAEGMRLDEIKDMYANELEAHINEEDPRNRFMKMSQMMFDQDDILGTDPPKANRKDSKQPNDEIVVPEIQKTFESDENPLVHDSNRSKVKRVHRYYDGHLIPKDDDEGPRNEMLRKLAAMQAK